MANGGKGSKATGVTDDRGEEDRPRRLGEKLKQLRVQGGLTQRALAQKLGVSTPALCRWERNQAKPKSSNIRALAKHFNVPESDLLSFIGDRNTSSAWLRDEAEIRDAVHNLFGNRQQSLVELLAICKRRIAEAAGTSPERVRIVIEV